MEQVVKKLDSLKERFATLSSQFGLAQKTQRLSQLESEMEKEEFWKDQAGAQKVAKEASRLKAEIEKLTEFEKEIAEAAGLTKLAVGGGNQQEIDNLSNLLKEIDKRLSSLEKQKFFSGAHDIAGAIISIHAGAGGTEAADWVAMLSRMYQRYFSHEGWNYWILDQNPGEEAGLKSSTIEADAPYAYGILKGEAGVHRLVRISPFDADKLRHTSFALVEVMPVVKDEVKVEIAPEDLEFEAFRASGAGGQNVNKVSTAVRIRHQPTGITVTAQTERSQAQNRANALKILKAKLTKLILEQKTIELKKLKGEYKMAGWGNQIRSYTLHPYHLVKDLRTGVQTQAAQDVLDGKLDQFIEAEIKAGVGQPKLV